MAELIHWKNPITKHWSKLTHSILQARHSYFSMKRSSLQRRSVNLLHSVIIGLALSSQQQFANPITK
jgi:hypothetical protein